MITFKKGYCCHCNKQVELGGHIHGRNDRFYAVGHKCPIKYKMWGRWHRNNLSNTPVMGMIEDPRPKKERKGFKRPDKLSRRAYNYARRVKKSFLLEEEICVT